MARDSRSGPETVDGGAELVVEPDAAESTLDAVARGITSASGTTIAELDPLYERVDVEALERVVEHASAHDNEVRVAFTIEGCVVTVRSDGRVRVRDDSA